MLGEHKKERLLTNRSFFMSNSQKFDYNYLKSNTKKNGKNTHKFIATAVEACLGAIYDEEKNMAKVIEIVQLWKDMVDKSCNE